MTSLADERQRRLVLDALWLGVVGAFAAQVFTLLLDLSQEIFLKGIAGYSAPGLPAEGGVLKEVIGPHGLWLIPLVTTLGGLISGVLVFSIAPEAEGHGTDSAVKSFHTAGGFIRGRVAPLKTIASAITIGSGGAAGREGPTALIAAGIGSFYGTLRHRTEEERRMLVLIGMAAGLSAIFRTPIGAAIIAIEVLYREMDFETDALLYTLLASVVAYTVNGMFVGWDPLFSVPADLDVSGAGDYLEYAVLGITGGVVAAILPTVFYKTRDFFHKIPVPPHIKPAIGGLGLGLMALVLPEVLGGGYGWIQMAMDGNMALDLLVILMFAKIIAMSLTVSSGGSGGVFAPSLFAGAMLGGVLAEVFGEPPAAFVLVGMAAVFSGAGRVPIATLFMVTEMTGGYHLLAPAALVVTFSMLVQGTLTSRMKYNTLYEAQIPTRKHRDVDLLEGVRADDAMATDYDWVPPTMSLDDLIHEFRDSHHHGFVVKDENGELFGVVTLGDVSHALVNPGFEELTVGDIATTTGLAVANPDESMSSVLWRMGVRGVGRVPVVSRDEPRKLLGVIRRRDVIKAYESAMNIRTETSYKLKELRAAHEGRIRVVDVDIDRNHRFVGKSVADIAHNIPEQAILVSVRRGKRLIIPHGDTILQDGDHLVLLAGESCADEAYASLSSR